MAQKNDYDAYDRSDEAGDVDMNTSSTAAHESSTLSTEGPDSEEEISEYKKMLYKSRGLHEICKYCYIKDESARVMRKEGQEVCSKCHNKWTHLLYKSVSSGDLCRPYPREHIRFNKKIRRCTHPDWCDVFTCECFHSDFEYDMWKDEQEILRAVLQPKSNIRVPLRGNKVPSICKDMLVRGYCKHRSFCDLPHSWKEFKLLEKMTRLAAEDDAISDEMKEMIQDVCDIEVRTNLNKIEEIHQICLKNVQDEKKLSFKIKCCLLHLLRLECDKGKLLDDVNLMQLQGFQVKFVNYARYFIEELAVFLKYLMYTVCGIPETDSDDYMKGKCTYICHFIKKHNSRLAELSSGLSDDQIYMYAYALHVFTFPTNIEEYCDLRMSKAYINVLLQYGIEIVDKFVDSFGGINPQHQKILKQHQATLNSMEEEFHEFCLFQEMLRGNRETYNTLTQEERKMVLDRILQDSRSHEMIAVDVATKLGLTISDLH